MLNRAFFDGRRLPGHHVIAPGGPEGDLARRYNVAVSPTRMLVDASGAIVDKYVGTAFLRLQSEVARRVNGDLSRPSPFSSSPQPTSPGTSSPGAPSLRPDTLSSR